MESRALLQTHHAVTQRYGGGEMFLTVLKMQTKCIFFLVLLIEMDSVA